MRKDIYEISAERVNDVCGIPLCTVMETLEIDPNEIVSLMDEEVDWVDFFGILIWIIIIRMYYRYVTKQTNTTNENT
ncbi:hypothetical protein FC699_16045 [Bacillus wiedmannii]|uniref:Uncharacterized protein n=1 Tax=Bacillus wiedmannii TaxID=1890302 RepID=A0A4V5TUJ9_9BACI|nr:hypothetical protein FC699_16045 [Bacillus wiedmannii]